MSQKKAMSVRNAESHEVKAPRSMMDTLGMRLRINATNVAAVAVSPSMLVSVDIDPDVRKTRTDGVDEQTARPGGPDSNTPDGDTV